MKSLLLIISLTSLFYLSIGCSQAKTHEQTADPLVARIFGKDIYLSSLKPNEKELSQYQSFYPGSSSEQLLTKI